MANTKKVTVDGIEVVVDSRIHNDFDLVMLIGSVQNGNPGAMFEVCKKVFGKDAPKVLDQLREEDGFLDAEKVGAFIGSVIKASGQKN